MAAARAQLGEAAWEEAFAQGMAMSAEEAAEYALSEEVVPRPSESAGWQENGTVPLVISSLAGRRRWLGDSPTVG